MLNLKWFIYGLKILKKTSKCKTRLKKSINLECRNARRYLPIVFSRKIQLQISQRISLYKIVTEFWDFGKTENIIIFIYWYWYFILTIKSSAHTFSAIKQYISWKFMQCYLHD